jgi:ribosomal protein S14
MARARVQYADVHRRGIAHDREPHSRLLRSIYAEHQIYSADAMFDSLHVEAFHFAHYILLKRGAHSMYRTTVRNRCITSGCARAVFGAYRLSRFQFKMRARLGSINGVTKSS